MIWFIAAALFLSVAGVFDFLVRFRMTRIGHRWAFLAGGAFNYANYRKVRAEYGWSAWPVTVYWICVSLGIALLVFATVRKFGL